MVLIKRKGQFILSYNPATDRYAISRYDGQVIDESNNRNLIDAIWRRKAA